MPTVTEVYYVVKWGLTRGILTVPRAQAEIEDGGVLSLRINNMSQCLQPQHWAATLKAAKALVEKQRVAKCRSLHRQLETYTKYTPQVAPLEDKS